MATVSLKGSTENGEVLVVDVDVAQKSAQITRFIEDMGTDDVIPIPNVADDVLAQCMNWCRVNLTKKRTPEDETLMTDAELVTWNKEFVPDGPDLPTQYKLVALLNASHFMEITDLLNYLAQATANMFKGKTPDQINKHWHLVDKFTPEEKEERRKTTTWTYDEPSKDDK